jgi:hypothetical protein
VVQLVTESIRHAVPRCPYCHRYRVQFADSYSIRYHDPEATLEQSLATLKRCIDEVAKRLVVAPGHYKVKVIDKDGVREVEL